MNDIAPPPRHELIERDQLAAYIESGCKPRERWAIGTEHEKFGYRLSDLRPLPYDGPDGIRAMLDGLTRFNWTPYYEGDNVIALTKNDGSSVTLEPGGQFELSGAPLPNLHRVCDEVHTHLDQVGKVAKELGVGFLGLGFQPKWKREEIPWMPKGRYGIMRKYMPTKGDLGLDMMTRTCTVQVNLDFDSEADMVRKLRVSLALQPVAVALFANSPFVEGKPSGYLSYRSHVWTRTDPDRCGMLPFAFEDGMGFERYVDYVLDVPMYFVIRDGKYIDVAGRSFRDFLAGKLPGLEGERPTVKDWEDHMTTTFPEVRIKRYMEVRGADGGPWGRLCALPALWVGLLYDGSALGDAEALVREWSHDDIVRAHGEVARLGLQTRLGGRSVQEIARDVVRIAREGLARRAVAGMHDPDERGYLTTLQEIAEAGRTPAEELLDAYATRWNGNVDPLFAEYAY
jgi:glutamate--cysteine ligase